MRADRVPAYRGPVESRTSTLVLEVVPAVALTVFLLTISPVAAGEPIDGWAYPLGAGRRRLVHPARRGDRGR